MTVACVTCHQNGFWSIQVEFGDPALTGGFGFVVGPRGEQWGEEHEERGKGIVESGGRAPAGRLGSAAGQVRGGVGQALMIRG